MSDTKSKVFRYIAYTIEIIIIFILNSTPDLLPMIYYAKPCLLICVSLSIAVFEREIPSMVFGVLCGALIDLGFSNSIGLFTIGLTILCFIIGYCSNNLLTANIITFLVCSLLVTAGLLSLNFYFSYAVFGYQDGALHYKTHYISRIVQTFIFSIPFYFLNKFIYNTFSSDE